MGQPVCFCPAISWPLWSTMQIQRKMISAEPDTTPHSVGPSVHRLIICPKSQVTQCTRKKDTFNGEINRLAFRIGTNGKSPLRGPMTPDDTAWLRDVLLGRGSYFTCTIPDFLCFMHSWFTGSASTVSSYCHIQLRYIIHTQLLPSPASNAIQSTIS